MSSLRYLLTVVILISLVSCGFNSSFYHPDETEVKTPVSAESQYVHYESDSVHVLHYLPESPKASILMLHGNAGNLSGWSEVADLFYLAGYEVYILDYPGFGNSSGKPKHQVVYAATDAVAHHFNQSAQHDKRLLMGFSLGGNLAVKVATDHPDYFNAMALEGAFDNHVNAARQSIPRPFRFLANLFVKNHIKGEELIQQWNKPLLVIHSKDDRTCPYEMGVSLHQNAASKNKSLWSIEGPHLSGISKYFETYMLKIENLIDNNQD